MDQETIGKLTTMLSEHAAETQKKIDEAVAKQTDVATAEVKTLREALEKIQGAQKAFEDEKKKGFGLPGFEKKEAEKFSMQAFMKALYLQAAGGRCNSVPVTQDPFAIAGAEYEREACKAYMDRRGRDIQGALSVVKDASSSDGTNMGFLIPPEVTAEIVAMVMPNMPVLNMPGVMKLNGLFGDLPVPKQTARHTAYHIGENAKPTASNAALALEWLRPKKVGAYSKQSNRLLYQSRGVADTIIKRSLGEAMAIEQHDKILNGLGSESQPTGILKTSGMTTTLAGSSIALAGAQYKIDDMLEQIQALAAVNEMRDTPSYGFLMNPNVLYGMLRQTVKTYSSQARKDAMPLPFGGLFPSVKNIEDSIGHSIKHTTHIAGTETAGSSSTTASTIFADWSLLWYATWRDPIFRVSDVASDGATGSAFLDDQLYMLMFMEYDCKVMRPAAFCVKAGAETNPKLY